MNAPGAGGNPTQGEPAPAIVIVVAVAENGVIGRAGAMPWRLSTDLKRFKALTLGKPMIMGRKTFASIGGALPGRTTIVVTRSKDFAVDGVLIAHDLGEAFRLATGVARQSGADEIIVAGGGDIYAQALAIADRLHVTHVHAAPEGDTNFPAIDPAVWRISASEDVSAGEKDSVATRYVVYERVSAAS